MRTLGYDNSAINQNLILDLPFEEGVGTITRDIAKPRHPLTATGTPTWANISGLGYLDFNSANPDYFTITAANSLDLDFTSGSYSAAIWMARDGTGATYMFFKSNSNRGWSLTYNNTTVYATTYQAGTSQLTGADNAISTGIWCFIVMVRNGTSIRIYSNGIDKTSLIGSHTNPLSSAADVMLICSTAAGLNTYDGKLYRPRIWSRALAPREINELFQRERGLFNV